MTEKSTSVIYLMVCCFLLSTGIGDVKAQNADFEWVKSIGGGGTDYSQSVVTDVKGNVYITGYFSSQGADFNTGGSGGMLSSLGGNDGYIAKYDPKGTFLWAKGFGGGGGDQGFGITVDGNGNVFIAGRIPAQGGDFNPGGSGGVITSAGGTDGFVAKYDSSGAFQWAKSMGGTGADQAISVSADGMGNVYVAGNYRLVAEFNPGGSGSTVTSAGGVEGFVAKYDPSGTFLWVKSVGGTSSDYCNGVVAESNGNVYIAGYYGAAGADLNIGGSGGVHTSDGWDDVFVAKYDSSGKFLWSKSMGGAGYDNGMGIAADGKGNVFVTGIFEAPGGDFNRGGSGGALTSAGGYDVFVAKFDSQGVFQWAKAMGGAGNDLGYAVAASRSGHAYVTGYYNGANANFNVGGIGGTVSAKGGDDIFVAKFEPNGTFIWVKSMGGTSNDIAHSVTTAHDGHVYVAGIYPAAGADFNPGGSGGALTTAGGTDGYLVKFTCSDTSSFYFTDSAPCGFEYVLNGEVYTVSGTYEQHLPNAAGCDSTLILELTFIDPEPIISIEVDTLSTTQAYASYQWIRNGTDISGATQRNYTLTENGNYQVRVTNEEGCPATSAVYEVSNRVGINDHKGIGQQVSIYPNPAHDVINIHSAFPLNASLSSIEGRSVRYVENAHTLPVSGLAEGIYLLRLADKSGRLIKVEKVIIQ